MGSSVFRAHPVVVVLMITCVCLGWAATADAVPRTSFGTRTEPQAVVSRGEKIYIGGTTTSRCSDLVSPCIARRSVFVARVSRAGEIDKRYGRGGFRVIARPKSAVRVSGIARGSKGRLYLGLSPVNSSSAVGASVLALDKSGKPLPSFGRGGLASIPRTTLSADGSHDLQIDAENGLLVGGRTPSGDFGVARLRHDGTLDQDYGFEGVARFRIEGYPGTVTALRSSRDGLLVAGMAELAPAASEVAVGRLDQGHLDTAFLGGGRVLSATPGGYPRAATPISIAETRAGNLLIAARYFSIPSHCWQFVTRGIPTAPGAPAAFAAGDDSIVGIPACDAPNDAALGASGYVQVAGDPFGGGPATVAFSRTAGDEAAYEYNTPRLTTFRIANRPTGADAVTALRGRFVVAGSFLSGKCQLPPSKRDESCRAGYVAFLNRSGRMEPRSRLLVLPRQACNTNSKPCFPSLRKRGTGR